MIELTVSEQKRYHRHLTLPQIGSAGQLKLRSASVLLVGVGGLGSISSQYLAAAGVGRIGIVDYDTVDVSNLHRQVLYGESTIGSKKVHAAKARLLDLNPHVEIVTHDLKLDAKNALGVLADYDIVADGTDNFATRYLVNDACHLLKKPNVYASIYRFEGQVSVFDTKAGPCYRCLFPNPPSPDEIPSCAEGGVLGVLPAIAGALQANEVIKMIAGIGTPLAGRLLSFDALSLNVSTLRVAKDPDCGLCGSKPTIVTLQDLEPECEASAISVAELRRDLARIKLIDVREPHEWQSDRIDEAILMPLGQLESRASELDRNEAIVLYCQTGKRSALARRMLAGLGFTNVRSLDGGMISWRY